MTELYFDRGGNPVEMMEWARLHADDNIKRVALEEREGISVSTVWLGLNHRLGGDGPPLIFETMIFGGDHDQDQWRYATEAEALEGHAEAVASVWPDA